DPGVVDQDVHPAAKHPGRLGGEIARHPRRAVEVCRDEVGTAARGPDLIENLATTLAAAAADGDVGSFGGERSGDRAPDVAGGAGDQRGLPFEAHSHTAAPFVVMVRCRGAGASPLGPRSPQYPKQWTKRSSGVSSGSWLP